MGARYYLDHNATAPLLEAAREAMVAAMDAWGNPSSVHGDGRRARALIDRARREIAARVGVGASALVFTAGATEANHLALQGTGRARLLVSAIEHDSVLAIPGAQTFAVHPDGTADLDALDRALAADDAPAVVSLMAANNETGVIQPVADAAAVAHGHGALLHVDATQAIGRIAVDRDRLGADLLSFSAHKIGGPKGVGALALREGVALSPLMRGGGQEQRRRAGTENTVAIAGFAAAMAAQDTDRFAELAVLRDRLERAIADQCPQACFWGAQAPRVANTSCIAMPDVASETQVMAFDLAGIAVSAGSACSSGKVTPSHVLTAMGAGAAARHAIRVSPPPGTTDEAIDAAARVWGDLWRRHSRQDAA